MVISVDFWKSMHGFAMDSRTKVERHLNLFLFMCVLVGEKVSSPKRSEKGQATLEPVKSSLRRGRRCQWSSSFSGQ